MERGIFYWIGFLLQEFWPNFWKGTLITIQISVLGTVLGFLLGFLIGIFYSTPAHPNDNTAKKILLRFEKALCLIYVNVFRGTPMMVQAMIIYYGLRTYGVAITSFIAAILVVLLNTGAYMAESVRGAIHAIDNGQFEGGKAMGMSHLKIMMSVVMPQVFRNLIPEMGNQFITNLKMTSVLNVVGISELYFVTKTTANIYYKYFEAFLITGMIYLVLCTLASQLLKLLEKKMAGKNEYEIAAEYLVQ
ncbi:MAG: amino acid ABC transporter permease [Oscillospiraceae bacterium]|jgi:putative lysine transport system permease protein|nr:amino acid ABC transporter permease [Oscillospiraceae bacterium]